MPSFRRIPPSVTSIWFDAVGTLIHPHPGVAEAYLTVCRKYGSRLPLDEGSAVGKHRRAASFCERRRLEAPHDRAVADVHHGGGDLRAADVNPDRGAHRRITSNTVEASQPYKPSPRPTFDVIFEAHRLARQL